MPSKEEARRQLNWGYFYIACGFLFAIFSNSPKGSSLFWAYLLWSVYWGYNIISQPFDDFFRKNTPIHLTAINADDYVNKTIKFKYSMLLKKMLWGLFFGIFGGAIYKQFTLSKIAYFQ